MSIEQQRRDALDELRDLLSSGAEPATAIEEAARTSGLRADVVARIGAKLVEEQPKLISAKQAATAQFDRRRRADEVLRLYRERLSVDRKTDFATIEALVDVSDFSKDESGDLFIRSLDIWLNEHVKGS